MSRITSPARRLAARLRTYIPEPQSDLIELTPEDRRYLTSLYDDSTPLPAGAQEFLRADNPRLVELRDAYASLDLPVLQPSRWKRDRIEAFLDLRYFRGETLITWHYRELPRITALKYFLFARYIEDRDSLGLLSKLDEDGAFGCWTYEYPEHGRFSRDLIESVNEICFLERQLGLSARESFRILDIGAGYGRLGHRLSAALPNLTDYCCVDAIPESTFLCEYYLRYRRCSPPARVVPLNAIETELEPNYFDLALNIHSFSECPYDAVAWWIELVRRLGIPDLLVVPNEPSELLTLEPDGDRCDFAELFAQNGYRLTHREPVIDDPAVRELVGLHDHFYLFRLG
jgi:SAM-dependent methyltransferase